MKLDSDTLQKIKEPILRAELAIAEIMAQYKVTRRQCNEAMYILGVNPSQREAEVRYNKSKAEALIDEMCRRLFTNPIKDDYRFELSEQ